MTVQRCPICLHPNRQAIERDILRLQSPTAVVRKWSVPEHTFNRKTVGVHRGRDMDPLAAIDMEADTSTLTRVEDLSHRLEAALADAPKGAAYANLAGQLRQALELLARLRRELDERPQVAILAAPEWLTVREVVFHALTPYPDARAAVAAALSGAGDAAAPPLRPRRRVRALPGSPDSENGQEAS
jgi:hypothetical protein